ncbi:MAG: hypothetical protein WAT36_02250 [Chromatiaceae bacterium]
MPTTSLPIATIRALRLTCRSCGAAVVIPRTADQVPTNCFNCVRPQREARDRVMKLLGELRWLQDYTATPGASVRRWRGA